MNFFQDYFSDYVDQFQLSTLGNGRIERFTVKRSSRELSIVLSLGELVDYSVFREAEESIKANMQLSKVTIKPRYVSDLFESSYLPSIVEFVKRNNPAANGFFENCDVQAENGKMTVYLKKGGRDILLAQKVNEDIENVIFDLFGTEIKADFVETENYDIEKEVKKAYAELQMHKEQEKQEQQKNVKHTLLGDFPIYGDTKKNIFGKNIKERPKAIGDVKYDDRILTVV